MDTPASLDGQPAVVHVRLWLEQGRVLNSSEQPEPARPRFLRAHRRSPMRETGSAHC